MSDLFNSLSDSIKNMNRLYTEVQELAAIWPEKAVKANDKLTRRITAGDLVTVEDGNLVNEGDNTHVITTCWGTLNSNFSISVIDLKTFELSKIDL